MTNIKKSNKKENFNRAWRWICSNLDSIYKEYFRNRYTMYVTSDQKLLEEHRLQVKGGTYGPKCATKLFMPEPSGILRSISEAILALFVNIYLFGKIG